MVFILLLDEGNDHQNQPIAADTAQVRSTQIGNVDKLLKNKNEGLKLRILIYIKVKVLIYERISSTDCNPLCSTS